MNSKSRMRKPIAEYVSPWDDIDRLERSSQGSADVATSNTGGSVASGDSANPSGSYDPSKWQKIDERMAKEIAIAESIQESIELAMKSQSVMDSAPPTLESHEEPPHEDAGNGNWLRRLHRAWVSAQAPVVPPETELASKPPSDLQSEVGSKQDSDAREMLGIVYDGLLGIKEKAKSNPSLLDGINSVLSMLSGFESYLREDFAETQTAGDTSSSNGGSKVSTCSSVLPKLLDITVHTVSL